MGFSFRLAALALVALPVFVGCAASTSDDSSSSGAAVSAGANDPVTLKNFLNHPKIVEIRTIVAGVEADLAAKKLTDAKKENLCEGIGEASREKLSSGTTIRRLILAGGSDDSAETTTLTYDTAGNVRFAYTVRNDVHGNSADYRTYFAADGTRLIEVERFGHSDDLAKPVDLTTIPYALSDEPATFGDELEDPAKRFDSAAACD